MICPKCGASISDSAKFCTECGEQIAAKPVRNTKTEKKAEKKAEKKTKEKTENKAEKKAKKPEAVQPPANPARQAAPSSYEARPGIPAPGWSDRIDHPDILAAMKKNSKAAVIFALILVPLPLLGFVIYSLVSQKMVITDALLYGGIVSAVFLVFALISLIRNKTAKPYEATVIEKKTRLVQVRNNSEENRTETEYVTYARTTDGRKKKIVEREGGMIVAYDYLNIGDRFRCHPQFNYPYELYDKSKAPYLYCVSCGKKNDVHDDRCQRCGTPLLK